MIEVEGITKIFGTVTALKDVFLKVDKGDTVGLLGPNGAGKTTLIRILACFLPPTSGVARVCGFDVTRQSLDVRRRVGYFIESVPLYSEMRVSSFLTFIAGLKCNKKYNKKEVVSEAMELCGLGQVRNRIIKNLSKGYRQRVGLAQALINQPEVLILDEPTIGLDPEQLYEVRKLIKRLSNERTVIISSHILSEITMLCNKVVIMNKGQVIAEESPENLRSLLQNKDVTNVQIEGNPILVSEQLNRISGVSKVSKGKERTGNVFAYCIESKKGTDVCRELCKLPFKYNWVLREIKSVEMSLEEIFIRILANEKENLRSNP